MSVLFVISGVTGMTGNELVHQILSKDDDDARIIGFDNFYASSIETVEEYLDDNRFDFFEYQHLHNLKALLKYYLYRSQRKDFRLYQDNFYL